MPSLAERFESKINRTESCWLWIGCVTAKNGYGRIADASVKSKWKSAHRVSYELFVGPIPDGKMVCHHCDNPPCVNPAHLFLGTNQDNMIDMIKKGRGWNPRGAMTVCINGHPLSGENLKIKSDGSRRCLFCLKKFEIERSKKRRLYAASIATSN